MGLAYLASLVVALGILLMQIVMGGQDDASHELESGEVGGDADADGEVDGDADHGHEGGEGADAAVLSVFLSTRFWLFAALAFGLSGTLLHYLDLATALVVALLASGMGMGSGLFSVFIYRAIRRSSSSSTSLTSDAAGQIGRMLVSCKPGKIGKVRVELSGQSIDLLAKTDGEEIGRGEPVLIEEVRQGMAHVSRRPIELE